MYKENGNMIVKSLEQGILYDMLTEEELEMIYTILTQSMERHMKVNNQEDDMIKKLRALAELMNNCIKYRMLKESDIDAIMLIILNRVNELEKECEE